MFLYRNGTSTTNNNNKRSTTNSFDDEDDDDDILATNDDDDDNIVEEDLMAFLNYVKAFPGNYVSRNLKISETFATWVVYGAPTP